MTTDWDYVRRIILNDRIMGYKPDRLSLDKLASRLPDVKVIGFGVYSVALWKTWFLLVESKYFWADYSGSIQSIPINQLPGVTPRLGTVHNIIPPNTPA